MNVNFCLKLYELCRPYAVEMICSTVCMSKCCCVVSMNFLVFVRVRVGAKALCMSKCPYDFLMSWRLLLCRGEKGWFRIVRGTNNLAIESDCDWAVPKMVW